jgi:hypothetical protein
MSTGQRHQCVPERSKAACPVLILGDCGVDRTRAVVGERPAEVSCR